MPKKIGPQRSRTLENLRVGHAHLHAMSLGVISHQITLERYQMKVKANNINNSTADNIMLCIKGHLNTSLYGFCDVTLELQCFQRVAL
jgi:hypothetical protein